ncbi:lamin tail domain-containing protein 1 isoform X2 [Engystomops pustulosus]|uniref:lamin tail domain-containing protein 1 isoform X2 n=1 Tax=Engystomops pustulosus TaxID=76066 RepID=UPI003AFA17D1
MIPPSAPSPAAEVARRNSEKAQIRDITERFRNYIQDVRSLRSQLQQADAASSVHHLHNEVVTLRNMYEEEIGNLREKLEQSYRAQDGAGFSTAMAAEYQDRIWQMNRDILKKDEDIRSLQALVAQKESDIQGLKGAAISPTIQLEMARQELGDLQRNMGMAQTRYEEEFSQRLTLEEKVRELTQQMEGLKYNHMKEAQELRAQVAQSEALVLQLEDQLRRMSRGGPALMETVQKIQEASEAEVKRLQDETETAYSQSLLELQMRLHNDQMLLGEAQEDKERLLRRVEELTSEVTSLEKKLLTEESGSRILMEKVEAEHLRGRRHLEGLESRLEELQDLLLAKMKELSTYQETNVSLRNELDALRSLLEEEELQMTSCPPHRLHTPASASHLLPDTYPAFMPHTDYTKTRDPVPECTPSDSSMVSISTVMSDGNHSSSEEKPDPLYAEDDGHPIEVGIRPETSPLESATTSDTSKRQGSISTMMENNLQPQVVTSTPSTTGGGIKSAVSSAIGEVEITEIHPGGHFVKIANRSLDKEEDIGSYLLQQNIRGHPVSIYRFPPKSRIFASSEVTVWASASGVPHKPPTDYLWKEQNKFVTEPKCTTILCNPNGQAVAWFTPLRDKTRKSLEKYEIFKSEPKITSAELMKEPNLEVKSDGRSRAPRSPPACGRLEKVPRLLRREKISPSVLPVTSSPWTQSTASPTHPDFNPGHLVSLGSDESSLCRQTRSLTAKTAPSSDIQGMGHRIEKDPSGSQRQKTYRGPIRSAGSNSRGVLYLGYSSPAGSILQKYFTNSSYNLRLASQVSLAPTILSSV